MEVKPALPSTILKLYGIHAVINKVVNVWDHQLQKKISRSLELNGRLVKLLFEWSKVQRVMTYWNGNLVC